MSAERVGAMLLLLLVTLAAPVAHGSSTPPERIPISIRAMPECSGFTAVLQVFYHLTGLKAQIDEHMGETFESGLIFYLVDSIRSHDGIMDLHSALKGVFYFESDADAIRGSGPRGILSHLLSSSGGLWWMRKYFGEEIISIGTRSLEHHPYLPTFRFLESIFASDLAYLALDILPEADTPALLKIIERDMFLETAPYRLEAIILRIPQAPVEYTVLVRQDAPMGPSNWYYLNDSGLRFKTIRVDEFPRRLLVRRQVSMMIYTRVLDSDEPASSSSSSSMEIDEEGEYVNQVEFKAEMGDAGCQHCPRQDGPGPLGPVKARD